jgi:aminopeptidase-like protein
MPPVFLTPAIDTGQLTSEADALLGELFPLCRSLTGEGVRRTLRRLQGIAEFDIVEIPSGRAVYDWEVPDEWNIRSAYLESETGERIIDFADHNLHVVGYSEPVDAWLTWQELEPHLHSLPDLPHAIPYRTSYYSRDWGFCLSHDRRGSLDKNIRYRAVIDATLEPGSMTLGEAQVDGSSGQEYLISSYCCHPSLANDSLSGVVLWALLLRQLQSQPTRHSYRFVILPETIGAIAYLAENETMMKSVNGGYIPTTVAGPGPFGYKRSFAGKSLIDRTVRQTFRELKLEYIEYPFDINGSDEKQYSAPAFRIPIGTICKSKYYEYEAYHTSDDNLDFISAGHLVDSLKLYMLAIEKIELNLIYRSLAPHSEPMFGKRGLYPNLGGSIKQKAADMDRPHDQRAYQIDLEQSIYGNALDAMRWVMFYADGKTSLLDIAEATELPLRQLYETGESLREHGLLEIVGDARED